MEIESWSVYFMWRKSQT